MTGERSQEPDKSGDRRARGLTVAVAATSPLEQAALEALLATLPGLSVVALTSAPTVILWSPSPATSPPPEPSAHAAILALCRNPAELPRANIAGVFATDETPAALGIAIRQIARGQEYLSPSVALALLKMQENEMVRVDESDVESLTAREHEVLSLLSEGLSNKEIAARLYLSVRTVEGHLVNAYAKLDVHSRTEAALLAARLLRGHGDR